jgi:hypothetical protein
MNILEMILNAQGGGAASQLGNQFGLDAGQTQSALGALLPALAGAVTQNARGQGGLEGLIGALGQGRHARYLDEPASLGDPATVQDGNGILGHLLGSKEVSREVASRASQQTGIGADVLKRMLPVVAAMLMGGLAKGAGAGGAGLSPQMPDFGAGARAMPGGGLLDMLTPMLDSNRDGSALDDVLRMASGFLNRR